MLSPGNYPVADVTHRVDPSIATDKDSDQSPITAFPLHTGNPAGIEG